MSMGACLADLVTKRAISQAQADAMRPIYDELVAQYEPKFGRAAAEAMATEKAMASIRSDFGQRKRQLLLQQAAQARILTDARTKYDGGKGKDGVLNPKAMLASLVRDEKSGGIANLEYRWKNIKQSALGQLYDVLAKHRANLLGEVRNKSDLDDMVRELSGEATGSLNARELADAWTQTAELLRGMFNAAGGAIGKLEGWGLPHRHDAMRIGTASADQWIAEVLPRLDREKMIDYATGAPMADGKIDLLLRDMYEAIVSDGWSRRVPGAMGGSKVANRHAEHRILHFRSADDWLGYNERFGDGTAFDAMMGHVEVMSRDIAAMQILGPNPAQTIRWMGDMVEREAAMRGGMAERGRANITRYEMDAVWNEVMGQNRRVLWRGLALFGSTLRNWQAGTKLGSATLASISDHATAAMTRHYNGLPATQLMGQYLKQMNPTDAGDREFARRAGIIGDEFTGRMAAQGRMHMEDAFGGRLSGGQGAVGQRLETANELSRRMADGVLRVSGLNAHTVAVRETMGMEFMAALAQYRGTEHGQLNAAFRGFLDRYGIGPGAWDAIRATPPTEYKGMDWIRPDDIADRELRDRFMDAMLTEIDYAVPTGGLRTRAWLNALRPGNPFGELIRTGFQFKMFPITVMAMHGGRMMAQSNTAKRATYAVAFLGATTLAGAMSYQLSELAKGKDPRDMQRPDFWWRATLKGGGLGVFGDAIEFSRNEWGQDIGDIVKGPSFSTAQNVVNAGKAAWATATVDMDDPDAVEKAAKLRGKAVRDLMTRETPGASIWFIRAVYERLLVDQVAAWAGDDIEARARRMEKRAEEEGGGYYAPPGGGAWRAPDFGNALGGGEQPEAP